ncbi:Rieske (2Fe-2S) protein [Filimonas effusa]|uniref:(2Fe-2S)-binding protein n=1 Tax=Filimonas effusa TaxID=2508721 RepID=A0A4Q1D551_9BACT|nr:nitrite reductase (NAD(P)H) small subunit [Filimonas effusa]RXK83569.1 (2Fe-2S)-binding protein [Filimonas effusa]
MSKKINWHKLADAVADFSWQSNNMCVAEVAGKKLTLVLFQDAIFATAFKCPHASGVMADGFVDAAGNIVCPLHRYKFSLKNGRNTSGEGYYLKVYAVEQREDGIYVGIESSGLFGWL